MNISPLELFIYFNPLASVTNFGSIAQVIHDLRAFNICRSIEYREHKNSMFYKLQTGWSICTKLFTK